MDYDLRLKLRMQCLELAKQMCLTSLDKYGVETLADQYWRWLTKEEPIAGFAAAPRATNPDDDVPF